MAATLYCVIERMLSSRDVGTSFTGCKNGLKQLAADLHGLQPFQSISSSTHTPSLDFLARKHVG